MSKDNSVLNDKLEECSHIIPSTPQLLRNKRSKRYFRKHTLSRVEINIDDFVVADQVNSEKCNTVLEDCYKCPYTFFSLTDILSFSSQHQPCHNNVRTIGVYTNNVKSHFLNDHRFAITRRKNLNISLDFKLIEALPSIGDTIEVFGLFMLSERVFVVQLWKVINAVEVQKNFSNLLTRINYMPLQYKKLRCLPVIN